MRHLKALMLIVLTISVMLLALTSCETVENVVGQIPGIENILPHQHAFVEGKCECGEIDPEYVAPHVHEFVNGKCECGEVDPSFSCIDHVWSEPVLESEATCTTEGRHVITCTVCGYQRYTPIFELGHDDDEVTVEPTCTEDGLLTKTCKRCGDVREEPIKATGHALSNDVYVITTAPTCTENGVVTYPCANCDYTESYEIPALGHHFVDGECECGEKFVPTVIEGDWALVTELKTGDRVLIGNAAYGKLLSADKVSAGSYYNKGVDFSADNFENVTDAEIWIVTVNDDGTYLFESLTGEKLGMAASYASLNSAGPNFSWSLTAKDETTFLIKNTARGNYLEWYASKGNWSTYSAGNTTEYYLSFYAKSVTEDPSVEHVHNYISDAHAPTCTEDGYTTYTCRCGETYTEAGDPATGHNHEVKVVAPTCTEAGYTAHVCACGDSYNTDEVAATGHNYVETTVDPTCTTAGYSGKICACGDKQDYVEIPKLGHVDENLDIECDRDGCTSKVAPAADSVLSTFTANCLGSKLSTSNKYYVVGTIVEVLDQKNGIFLLDDGTGETFYFRLPKNADGTSHANWTVKLTLGDKVQIYGAVNKFSATTAPNGQYWPAMQSPVATLLEQHPHDYTNTPATCFYPAYCVCGANDNKPLGHSDSDANNTCDACGYSMTSLLEEVKTHFQDIKDTDKVDTTNGIATFDGTEFVVTVTKGTASLNTNGSNHMRLNKGNNIAIEAKNGNKIVSITLVAVSETYLDELEAFLQTTEYEYTVSGCECTIQLDSVDSIELVNGNKVQRIASVKIVYEKPAESEGEDVEPTLASVTLTPNVTENINSFASGDDIISYTSLAGSEIFTLTVGDKTNNSNQVYLSTGGEIRLYSDNSDYLGNTLTIASTKKIVSIAITYSGTTRSGATFTIGETTVAGGTEITEETITVNANAVTIANNKTSGQLRITSIVITYEE